MRIALVHNPKAGDGEIERDDIRRLLEAQGHRVEEFGKMKHDVRKAIASHPEIIAVAGGDGTVGRAAITCFEEGATAPVLILPVGTANNIARSLGLDREIVDLIRGLDEMRPTPLDVGRVEAGKSSAHFVEAAGLGFIGTMLRRPPSRARRLARAVRDTVTRTDISLRKAHGVARLIQNEEAMPLAITADGENLSGDYIAVEAMNIREVGPNLCLAPSADPGDGQLDLVLFGPDDREWLATRVHHRVTRADPSPRLLRRVRSVEITWPAGRGHADDTAWPEDDDAPDRVRITVAGAINYLRPARSA